MKGTACQFKTFEFCQIFEICGKGMKKVGFSEGSGRLAKASIKV